MNHEEGPIFRAVEILIVVVGVLLRRPEAAPLALALALGRVLRTEGPAGVEDVLGLVRASWEAAR